ncbi:MAG: hypothetical protein U0T84_08700 [Chitinophagales bacterium]
MQKILIDINRQWITLNQQFTLMAKAFYDKNLKVFVEKALSKASHFVFNFYDILENWKTGKLTELVLGFLDEADNILDYLNSKIPVRSAERRIHLIRELIQVLRTYVIFLDQQRQEFFAQPIS